MTKIEEEQKTDDIENGWKTHFTALNIAKLLATAMFVVYLFIALILWISPELIDSKIWVEIGKFKDPLITVLPVIIAAESIFLVFYLGKLHDYTRDFIKQYGIFTEIKLLIHKKISKRNPIANYEELEDELSDWEDYYEDADRYFRTIPKGIFTSLGVSMAFFVVAFLLILKNDEGFGDTIFFVISIIFGLALIPIFIILNEKEISLHQEDLRAIIQDIAYMKFRLN